MSIIHYNSFCLKTSATFGTCTVVSVNGTLDEDKMLRFKGACAHCSFNKCPIYTHDGASAKFSTNSHETDKLCIIVFLLVMFSWLGREFLILYTNRSEIDHLKVCVGSEKTYSHSNIIFPPVGKYLMPG